MCTSETRLTFAIVEDQLIMAEMVGDMITSAGADFETFSCGAAILQCADIQRFKAILLDLTLPDADGFEIMDTLAETAPGLSIVLMSGHDAKTVRAAKIYGDGIGLNVQGCLTKPFAPKELLAALGLGL